MVEAGDYILVHFLADEPLGKRFQKTRHQWPMHMTLVPWFVCADVRSLCTDLEKLARSVPTFDLTLGEVEQFHTGATVSVVANPVDETKLHEALLKTLTSNGSEVRDTHYVHAGRHKAHVTHHDGQRVPQTGDVLRVDAFYMVRLLQGNMCEIAYRFVLGGKQ